MSALNSCIDVANYSSFDKSFSRPLKKIHEFFSSVEPRSATSATSGAFVAFTGSGAVGKLLMQYSGQSNLKRVSLELGGKSPHIVFDDCPNIARAATEAAWGIFYNSGQVCTAGSRLLVQDGIADQFIDELLNVARKIEADDPLEPKTKCGSMVSSEQMKTALRYIETAKREGASLALGGGQTRAESGGFYLTPTVFDQVAPTQTIAREEIFGPVLAITRFKTPDDAIRIANGTVYGLAAGLWTRDVTLAHRAAREIKAGLVWVNGWDSCDITMPFGGFKQSGFGRDRSLHALHKYADLKAISITLAIRIEAMNAAAAKFPIAAFIGGEWVGASKTFAVTDPATGENIARVPDLMADDARRAVDAAHKAFPAWAATTAKERGQILRRWFDLITAETEPLAQLMTAEQGKPLAELRGEVAYGASFVEWFAEEGKRAYGHTIPTTAASRRYVTIKQPIGVVAAITPWNFPIAMITRKVACALAAGCTVVVKPAEDTPLCALAIAKLAQDAGVPAGVFNIITSTDAAAIGKALCEDDRVRKLTFTGSTEVGRILYRQCADTIKKLTLELGGNAPLIVFDDADLDQAVAGTMASKFRNAGQTCVCANRILVQAGIYDRFAAALTEAVAKLHVAPGRDPKSTIGPLINADAVQKVEALMSEAIAKGAKVKSGGARDDHGPLFYRPTVLTDVTADMAITQTEIFGPVASLIKFKSDADAIRIANDTPFGLAAYLFSQNIGRAWRAAEQLEAGMIGVNEGLFSNEAVPFGGVKQSGLGREGGQEGLEEYLETKFICIGGVPI